MHRLISLSGCTPPIGHSYQDIKCRVLVEWVKQLNTDIQVPQFAFGTNMSQQDTKMYYMNNNRCRNEEMVHQNTEYFSMLYIDMLIG